MDTNQPDWELIANLGDADPIEYGGVFVYRDRTGVYTEECEILEPNNAGRTWEDPQSWTVYRFSLDRCTYRKPILSDNPYHPEIPAWFADDMGNVANANGRSKLTMLQRLCSKNPLARASGYEMIGRYHGWENLDQDPITITDRSEIEERYREVPAE
jgi:hypothetical protein